MTRPGAIRDAVSATTGDGPFAVVLAGASILTAYVAAGHCDCDRPSVGAYVLLACTCLPLTWRRRRPVLVWAVVGVAAGAYGLTSYADPPLYVGPMVALYSVAAHASRRWAVAVGAITLAAIGFTTAVDPQPTDLNDVVPPVLELATAWLLGDNMRNRRAYLEQLEDRAARLTRDREEDLRRAASEERARIARELHDVAAHHVSVIAVQAEAGRSLVSHDPDKVDAVLATISESARDALRELRRLLDVLRTDAAQTTALVPQPGLRDVPQLVEHVRQAGIDVEFEVKGDRGAVEDGLDLAGYRIVQEALTNVIKHSGARAARVSVTYAADAIRIAVVDDGRGDRRVNVPGGGCGLINMRERATTYGGELRAGAGAGGGFVVEATLPR